MTKAIRKLIKWYQKAEQALTRDQAQKAIKKINKWKKRLDKEL